MRVTDQIKLYFADWKKSNISALVILVVGLAVFFGFSINVPVGEQATYMGTIQSIGITNSSKYSASYSTANVLLQNGKNVQVVLPRSATPIVGSKIKVSYQRQLLSGGFYQYANQQNP